MRKSKNNLQKITVPVVTMPSVIETIKMIKPGTQATFQAKELGSYHTAYSSVRRLNERAGRQEFAIVPHDNATSYTVTRIDNNSAN